VLVAVMVALAVWEVVTAREVRRLVRHLNA
jgi:hypothetical protein